MSNIILELLMIAAAVVVFMRTICLAARVDRHRWQGHIGQFLGFSTSVALAFAGAIGLLLAWPPAGGVLLIGEAGQIVFDRRRQNRGEQ